MINELEVIKKILKGEDTSVDFKRQLNLKDAKQKSEFIKDIISLANSSPEGGFLIIGIDDSGEPVGFSDEITEEQVQQIASKYITPQVQLTFYTLTIRFPPPDEVAIGIVEVKSPQRPHKVARDMHTIKQNFVFVRRGSVIEIASPEEIMQMDKPQFSPNETVQNDVQLRLLEKIDFKYFDSPLNHSWEPAECENVKKIVFENETDGFVGKYIKIKLPSNYAIDYPVKPVSYFGENIEFLAKLERNSSIYVSIKIRSKNKKELKKVWLKFKVGLEEPYLVEKGVEWAVPCTPLIMEGEWLLFRINLREAIQKTFGKNGWELGQLIKLRLRGNLSLAHISIQKERSQNNIPSLYHFSELTYKTYDNDNIISFSDTPDYPKKHLSYFKNPIFISSKNLDKKTIDANFITWNECTMMLWLYVPPKDTGLREYTMSAKIAKKKKLLPRYIWAYNTGKKSNNAFYNQFSLRYKEGIWQTIISNNDSKYYSHPPFIIDVFNSGWHRFLLAWDKKVRKILFAINEDTSHGIYYQIPFNFERWPDNKNYQEEHKISIGCWPSYNPKHYCETKIFKLEIINKYLTPKDREVQQHFMLGENLRRKN